MSISRNIFEGTLEQINRHADRLAGKWLRVEIVDGAASPSGLVPPSDAANSPEARAQAILDWGYGHSPRNARPLSDEAVSRESIYSDERD